MRRPLALAALLLALFPAAAQETLRGRFDVELEPVSSMKAGDPYPLDAPTAYRRALDEAALAFAAMIYGWRFEYDVGDRSRAIAERFETEALGSVPFGDPRLAATDASTENAVLRVWIEYAMDGTQARSYALARQGSARSAQGTGSAPLSDGPAGKAAALRDAARAAVRSVLAAAGRNRPKAAYGTALLDEVPRYRVDAGRYECDARFRVTIAEVVPHQAF